MFRSGTKIKNTAKYPTPTKPVEYDFSERPHLASLTKIVPLDVCEWLIKSSGPVGSVLTTARPSSFTTLIILVHRRRSEVI